MVFWQVVELRSPAKEGSDAFVSTNLYYDWWPNYHWNGNMWTFTDYTEVVSFSNTLGENYQISSVSGLLPNVIPPLFTLFECTQLTGSLCVGSGIPPNETVPEGAPPLMIGAGPCELPFLVWQVDHRASHHSWPWNLHIVSHILESRCLALTVPVSYKSRIVNLFGFTTHIEWRSSPPFLHSTSRTISESVSYYCF